MRIEIKICDTIKGYYQLPYRLQKRIDIDRLTSQLHFKNYDEDFIEEMYELVQEFLEYEKG